jgi:hypothetical protein
MTRRLYRVLAAFLLATVFAVAEAGRTIQVDIAYTGSGTVDASHKIYVALWDSANFDGGPPADVQSLDSKTGTVTFTNVQKSPAYVSAAYYYWVTKRTLSCRIVLWDHASLRQAHKRNASRHI